MSICKLLTITLHDSRVIFHVSDECSKCFAKDCTKLDTSSIIMNDVYAKLVAWCTGRFSDMILDLTLLESPICHLWPFSLLHTLFLKESHCYLKSSSKALCLSTEEVTTLNLFFFASFSWMFRLKLQTSWPFKGFQGLVWWVVWPLFLWVRWVHLHAKVNPKT